jgi:hypothetical protein
MMRSLLLILVLVAGCAKQEGEKAEKVMVPIEKVPENLVKIAQEKLPEVKFDHARILPNGDYEIRGKGKNGKIREVELKPDGKLVEIE